jgi:hypothetical protein
VVAFVELASVEPVAAAAWMMTVRVEVEVGPWLSVTTQSIVSVAAVQQRRYAPVASPRTAEKQQAFWPITSSRIRRPSIAGAIDPYDTCQYLFVRQDHSADLVSCLSAKVELLQVLC